MLTFLQQHVTPFGVWLVLFELMQHKFQHVPSWTGTLKDASQARLCYCFDLKFAIKLLVERDQTSQQFNW